MLSYRHSTPKADKYKHNKMCNADEPRLLLRTAHKNHFTIYIIAWVTLEVKMEMILFCKVFFTKNTIRGEITQIVYQNCTTFKNEFQTPIRYPSVVYRISTSSSENISSSFCRWDTRIQRIPLSVKYCSKWYSPSAPSA